MIQSFCSTIYLAGLNETYRTKYNVIRAVWIVTFICGFIFTGYFIYNVIAEYQSNPIVTKVYLDHAQGLVFPDIYLDIKATLEVLNEFGLSDNTKYYINQLQSISSLAALEGFNKTLGKLDVEMFFAKHNLTTNLDFAKLMFSRFIESFEIDCDFCHPVFNYTSFNTLRYNIKLDSLDKRVVLSGRGQKKGNKRFFGFFHKEANFSSLYLPEIYIDNIQLKGIENVRKLVKVKGQMMKRYKEYSSTCTDEIDYSTMDCAKMCTFKVTEKCMGAEYIDGYIMDSRKMSTILYSEPTDYEEFVAFFKCVNEEAEKCEKTCVTTCTEILYDIVETVEGKTVHPEYEIELSHAFFGMVIFEQAPSYSFQSAVSNIGGQLGLWLGLSIVTVIQVVMFFVDICYDRVFRTKLKFFNINGTMNNNSPRVNSEHAAK